MTSGDVSSDDFSSGGFSLSSLNPMGALRSGYGKVSGIASGLKNRAQGLAMARMAPRGPSLPSFGSKDMKGFSKLSGQGGKVSNIAKIITFIILSIFIGIFFMYIHKKDQTYNFNSFGQVATVVAIIIVGLGISYFMKLDILSFLISSEINILCFYFILAYTSLTTFFTDVGFFDGLYHVLQTFGNILADPTTIFDKGFGLIIPLILFIIPLIVLVYNFTQNMMLALLVVTISLGVTLVLYPKNKNPIAGGIPLADTVGVKSCVTSNWDYLNPFNIGKAKCGDTASQCVDSNWGYANPFNWGKGKC